MTADQEARLLELLLSARDGGDSAARRELNDILRTDAGARATIARHLVDEQAIIGRLRDENMVEMLQPKPHASRLPGKPARSSPPKPRSTLAAIAAVLAFCAFLAWLALGSRPERQALPGPAPVALLKEELNAVWRDPAPATGTSLLPGTLRLQSGMASLEFASGARLLLEGPAEIEVISAMEAACRAGKILATVPPPARGFTLATPSSRLVDLGTIFGVHVRDSGSAIVKVLQGEVDVVTPKRSLRLTDREAASVDEQGNPAPARASDALFPSVENFNARIAAGREATATRWQAASDALAADPSALLAYHFREADLSSRSVRNHARHAGTASNGSLVGTGWTDGRWPGKRALEFNGRGDRMLFRLEGRDAAVTLMAWVRVDSLPNLYQILLMPDVHRASALSWMIDRDGNLRFAITNGKDGPGSPHGWDGPVKAPAVSDLDLGRWIFLATTYDSGTGTVRHYRDGSFVGAGTLRAGLPVDHGTYTFGNWGYGDRSADIRRNPDAYRNFNGRLDELAIFSRALSEAEIQAFHLAGKP